MDLKKLFIFLLFGSAVAGISLMSLKGRQHHFNFPSYNPNYPPPAGYRDPFSLSQDYPVSFDADAVYPWQAIDFHTDPIGYLKSVLKYDLEGNLDVDFVVQHNAVRKWYHAPWLHDDSRHAGNGREYIHGLTRERATPVGELDEKQDIPLENWAIGFYNEPGGYTIGKVWRHEGGPVIGAAAFPEGTTAFKLLFTDGTPDKVPFLRGSKEWTANIYPCDREKCFDRINRTVRLLQLDIAVKDKRSATTGWVFGTFVYDGFSKGATVWDRLVPVGLTWGDDTGVSSMINKSGSFVNPDLKEAFLNPALVKSLTSGGDGHTYMHHFGLGGRLNGPVDNPSSSCNSCHGRAANLINGQAASMGNFTIPIANYTQSDFEKYFATIRSGNGQISQGGKIFIQSDYSLQLTDGIRNYYQHQYVMANKAAHRADAKDAKPAPNLKPVTRDGN